jgi:hypothetical protein
MSGCTALLPQSSSATQVGWPTYEDARQAIDQIVPYEARRGELIAAGIDPQTNPAITILTFSDIVQRFSVGAAIRAEDLDPGVRQCLVSGKLCTGYAINVRHIHRDRIGNFWLDSFNFKREIETRGWSFVALILLVEDLVVHTLHGGQPKIHEMEIVRNPLGPLQGWAEQVAPALRR